MVAWFNAKYAEFIAELFWGMFSVRCTPWHASERETPHYGDNCTYPSFLRTHQPKNSQGSSWQDVSLLDFDGRIRCGHERPFASQHVLWLQNLLGKGLFWAYTRVPNQQGTGPTCSWGLPRYMLVWRRKGFLAACVFCVRASRSERHMPKEIP